VPSFQKQPLSCTCNIKCASLLSRTLLCSLLQQPASAKTDRQESDGSGVQFCQLATTLLSQRLLQTLPMRSTSGLSREGLPSTAARGVRAAWPWGPFPTGRGEGRRSSVCSLPRGPASQHRREGGGSVPSLRLQNTPRGSTDPLPGADLDAASHAEVRCSPSRADPTALPAAASKAPERAPTPLPACTLTSQLACFRPEGSGQTRILPLLQAGIRSTVTCGP